MLTREFVQLWKKLYILVQMPLQINLRLKHSVPKLYSFFLLLQSILIVVQLLKNVDKGMTEFVQLWKKWYILVQIPFIGNEFNTKAKCTKTVELFLWLYSFCKNIDMGMTEFV